MLVAIGAVGICGLAAGAAMIALPDAPNSAATVVAHVGHLEVFQPLASTGQRGGYSAVTAVFENTGGTQIVLTGARSHLATYAMLANDVAGCDPKADGSSMTSLPSLVIAPHSSLTMSAKTQAVMLMGLRIHVEPGTLIPVTLGVQGAAAGVSSISLSVPVSGTPSGAMAGMHM